MFLKRSVSQLGFTLIELMVVVSIIGVLMAAGILAFSNAQQNARDAKRRADIDAISKALEQYNANHDGNYTDTSSDINSYFPSGAIPNDPQGGSYNLSLITTGYCVCAHLEKAGRGNSTANGTTGVCAYGTGDYFCASQRQ